MYYNRIGIYRCIRGQRNCHISSIATTGRSFQLQTKINKSVRIPIYTKIENNVFNISSAICRFLSSHTVGKHKQVQEIEEDDQKWSSITEEEKEYAFLLSDISRMRNFSIIAHVDHGKSTLADRLLERTGNIKKVANKQAGQVLDRLQVERERGITIKAQTATMFYRPWNENQSDSPYLLNLIDTPGHVDFSFEVDRSLAACDGCLLLVDASQGIQAQTIANFYLAFEAELDIVPVLTKADLYHAEPEKVAEEMAMAFDLNPDDIILTSAKSGLGISEIFPAIVERIRPPQVISCSETDDVFRGRYVDSWYDIHRGVIALIQVYQGSIAKGDRVGAYHSGGFYEVQEVGILLPDPKPMPMLQAGQVGYVIAGVKNAREVALGDTFYSIGYRRAVKGISSGNNNNRPVTLSVVKVPGSNGSRRNRGVSKEQIQPLPGFRQAKCMVYASLYPTSSMTFEQLEKAFEKLLLNDASVQFLRENSDALGMGFRCGFLGVLHMNVFCERLEQEFDASVILTAPTVPFRAKKKKSNVNLKGEKQESNNDKDYLMISAPSEFPDPITVEYFEEPFVKATIVCPSTCLGDIMTLANEHRGEQITLDYLSETRVNLVYTFPLSEVVAEFNDKIKSISSGFASFDYEEAGYEKADLMKMEIRINTEAVDALSVIVVRKNAETIGRNLVKRLKKTLDRQNFEIVIQAASGNKILARERIPPFRKGKSLDL